MTLSFWTYSADTPSYPSIWLPSFVKIFALVTFSVFRSLVKLKSVSCPNFLSLDWLTTEV